jgi:hypothetical protein
MKSQTRFRLLFIAIIAISFLSISIPSLTQGKAKIPIYVGFLEADGPRRVFVLRDGAWHSALPDADSIEALNQERNIISELGKWTVFFDGKIRAQLSVKPVKTVTLFKNLGLQQISGKHAPLPARKHESQFSAVDGP